MAIKIKMLNGKVPENCMKILLDFAEHKRECLYCTMAEMQQLDFNNYCDEGQKHLLELSAQPEVSSCD